MYVRHKMTNVKSAGPWTENRVITEKVRFEDEKNRCQVLFTFQALEQHRSLEFVKFLVVIPLCVSVCVWVDRSNSDLLIYGGIKWVNSNKPGNNFVFTEFIMKQRIWFQKFECKSWSKKDFVAPSRPCIAVVFRSDDVYASLCCRAMFFFSWFFFGVLLPHPPYIFSYFYLNKNFNYFRAVWEKKE